MLRAARRAVERLMGTMPMVVTMAFGVGTVTVAFSIIEPLLLRPVPYRDAESLYELVPGRGGRPRGRFVAAGHVRALAEQADIFRAVDAYQQEDWATPRPRPRRVAGAWVTPGLLASLGVAPSIGRSFVAEDATEPVAVISDTLWRTSYGGGRDVLGTALRLQQGTFTVVGVMPRGFRFPAAETEVWLPLALSRDPNSVLSTVARVKRGVSFDAANGRLAALGEELRVRGRPYQLVSLNWRGRGTQADILPWLRNRTVESVMLMGALGLVLLLAWANVASLAVARAAFRRGEVALRSALGATPWNVFWWLLGETVAAAAFGGILAWLLSGWALAAVGGLVPAALEEQTFAAIGPDVGVLFLALGISALTGFVAGVGPAFAGARQSWGGKGLGMVGGGRGWLVLVQVAIATMLGIGAGQAVRGYVGAATTPVGLDTGGLLAAEPVFSGGAYGDFRAMRRLVENWADATEGDGRVAVAAASTALPLHFTVFSLDGPEADDGEQLAMEKLIRVDWVSPSFFGTVGIPVVEGSTFGAGSGGRRSAVISASLARQLWGEADAVGRRFRAGGGALREWRTVVGVAGDVSQRGVGLMADTHEVYLPLFEDTGYLDSLYLETVYVLARGGDRGATVRAVEEQLWRMAPDVPVRVRWVADLVRETVSEPRFRAALLGVFAGMALLLAMGGVYSVTSRIVAMRKRDIAIRMALGARGFAILADVIARECLWAVGGLGVGLFVAVQLSAVAQSWMPAMELVDPRVNWVVVGCLAVAVLAACAVPSWRAVKVDPVATLEVTR